MARDNECPKCKDEYDAKRSLSRHGDQFTIDGEARICFDTKQAGGHSHKVSSYTQYTAYIHYR